ncbi:MAG: hypothetical protein LUQ31_08910 [Methanoregula sp.]|nr:hypothetical protein [Methanoregula sp.]
MAGSLVSAVLSFATGIEKLPSAIIATLPAIRGIIPQIDIAGAIIPTMIPVIILILLLTLFDSIATIPGFSRFSDPDGPEPGPADVRKPSVVYGISRICAPLASTTTLVLLIESAAGINDGGRTCLTPVFVAGLIGALDLATSSALMAIGLLRMAPLRLKSIAEKE